MEIKYKVSESDFLDYQMYVSGESDLQRKRRFLGRLIVPIFWGLLGLYFVYLNELDIGVLFLVLSVIYYFAYPSLSKWRYRRHFKQQIAENYGGKWGDETTVTLGEEELQTSGVNGEGKVRYSAVTDLVELESLYLIRLKPAMTLLVPKNGFEKKELAEFMKQASKRVKIEIKDHRARQWK